MNQAAQQIDLNDEPSRFVQKDGQWFFKTRERRLMGPYDTVEEASQAVETYVSLMDIRGPRP